MPTGAGKTFVFTLIAKMVNDNNKRVLVLTHRRKLLEQADDSFSSVGLGPSIVHGNRKPEPEKKTFVSMAKTIVSRLKQKKWAFLNDIDLVIIDESHRGEFKRYLDQLPEKVFVLMVTATPYNASKNYQLRDYAQECIEPVTIPELVDDGYLVPCRTISDSKAFERITTSIKVANGKYTEQSQSIYFNDDFVKGTIADYQQKYNGKKMMVFAPNIERARRITELFNHYGTGAVCVTSDMSMEEMDKNTNRFENDPSVNVLVNCGILTTGYDFPAVEITSWLCKTKSITKWFQGQGRASRPCPEIGKKEMITLDYALNNFELGTWDAPMTWTPIFNDPEIVKKFASGKGVAPVKDCPKCGDYSYISARVCEACGHKFQSKAEQLKFVPSKMDVVKASLPKWLRGKTVSDLLTVQAERGFKNFFVLANVAKIHGLRGFEELAKVKNKSLLWAHSTYRKVYEYLQKEKKK